MYEMIGKRKYVAITTGYYCVFMHNIGLDMHIMT